MIFKQYLTKRLPLMLHDYIIVALCGALIFSTFYPLISKDFLVVAGILWVKLIDIEKLKQLFKNKAIIFLFLFYVYNLISFFWTPDKEHYYSWISDTFYFLLLPILLIATTSTKLVSKRYIRLFLFLVFMNELISYGIFLHLWLSIKDGYPVYFMHHSAYSVILCIAILLTYYELLHSNDNKYIKLIYSFFLITMLGNLILSGGRIGQVTLLISAFILFLSTSKQEHKNHIIFTTFFMTFLLGISFVLYPQFQDRTVKMYTEVRSTIENNNYETSIGNRLFSYVLTEKFISDRNNIIFGEGSGSTNIIKNKIIQKYYSTDMEAFRQDHLHQYFLNTFFETGLFGLALFILFIYYLAKSQVVSVELKNIKITIVSILVISNLFDRILFERSTMLVFALFIGLIIADQTKMFDIKMYSVSKERNK